MQIYISEKGLMTEDGTVVACVDNYEKDYTRTMYRFLEKLSEKEEIILSLTGVKKIIKDKSKQENEEIWRIEKILKSILQL